MTRESQKLDERRAAQIFIEAAMLDAELEDSESPDFVLAFAAGESIGLEVVRAVQPGIPESLSALRRVACHAEALLGNEKVLVVAVPRNGAYFKPDREAERVAAESLVRLTKEMLESGEDERTAAALATGCPEIAGFADSVAVIKRDDGPPIVDACSELYLGRAPAEELQRIISAKERLLPKCRARHPGMEQWLLVVTHAGPAQRLLPECLDEDHIFTSSFEFIYLLDGAAWKVARIRLAKP
jgi:hypothetical protein